MLAGDFDCLAVPLPESFQENVETAIESLPSPTVVLDERLTSFSTEWRPESEFGDDDEVDPQVTLSYVPIDPCQPVISALRIAMGERIPRRFVDLETDDFQPYTSTLPDPYALKQVDPERFAAAILPGIPPLPHDQARRRVAHMAARLIDLEQDQQNFKRILMLVSVHDWPWLREAYRVRSEFPDHAEYQFEPVEPHDNAIYAPEPVSYTHLTLPTTPYV